MICVNCGRNINGSVCDCCGTDYRTEEEKKKTECEHFYDQLRIEHVISNCSFRLYFRCRKCNKVLTVPTTEFLLKDLLR